MFAKWPKVVYFRASFCKLSLAFGRAKKVVFFPTKVFEMASHLISTLEPDPDNNCKLHNNSYDVQSCVLAGVIVLLGAVNCFYGKLEKNPIF